MVFLFGAGDEARTRYLDLGKVALYQMSYARKRKTHYTASAPGCQALFLLLPIFFTVTIIVKHRNRHSAK